MKKSILLFLFQFQFFLTPLFSNENLSNVNTSWTTVIPGLVISEPTLTSYGFCLITDAREITAFSNQGKVLWEKHLDKSKNAFVSTILNDFFSVVTNEGKHISLLNQSGSEIWAADVDFPICDKPFCGRDGRFFVRGKNNIQCFGINGICKWKLETKNQNLNLPVCEFNDGSLSFFLEQNSTVFSLIRISPFGELLEEYSLSDEVKNATSCFQGVLLTLKNGNSQLLSIQDKSVKINWELPLEQKSTLQSAKSSFLVSPQSNKFYLLNPSQTSVSIARINPENGNELSTFTINNINGFNLTKVHLASNGFFITDDTNAFFYSLEGTELWNAIMPPKDNNYDWNYLFYSNADYLIFCGKNWSINAYKIIQTPQEYNQRDSKSQNYHDFINPKDYFYSINYSQTLDRSICNNERIAKLSEGFYGPEEIGWTLDMIDISRAFSTHLQTTTSNTREEMSPFLTDTQGLSLFLHQLPLFSTIESVNYLSLFLNKLQNKSLISMIFSCIAQNGFDPDGELLESIEKISKTLSPREDSVIISSCDAIYSICRFMGRPAFNSKGKYILSRYLSPDYSTNVQKYVRKTLKKIADLNL